MPSSFIFLQMPNWLYTRTEHLLWNCMRNEFNLIGIWHWKWTFLKYFLQWQTTKWKPQRQKFSNAIDLVFILSIRDFIHFRSLDRMDIIIEINLNKSNLNWTNWFGVSIVFELFLKVKTWQIANLCTSSSFSTDCYWWHSYAKSLTFSKNKRIVNISLILLYCRVTIQI